MPRPAWGLLLLATSLAAQQYPFIPVAHSPNNVEHIIEDRQGRLWMTTPDDVLCFDGTRFFSLHDYGLATLPPDNINPSIREDDEGGILVNSRLGLHRFHRGRLEQVMAGAVPVDALSLDRGVLLVAAIATPQDQQPAAYVARAIEGRWQTERIPGLNVGFYLTRDRADNVLFTCVGGWCELPARAILDRQPGKPIVPVFHKTRQQYRRVIRDRFGCLWFRSEEAGAYQCADNPEPVPLAASIAGRNVWDGEEENDDGSMLIASI